MIRRFYILFCLVFLVACDDGDILTIDLDFDQELERCTNDNNSYLLYDTRDNPNESLLLIIDRNNANELLFTKPTAENSPEELTITPTSSTQFIYRSYNRVINGDELCDVIPPSDLSITESYSASSGTVYITTTVRDDDGDGIPTEFEGLEGDPDENGIYWDSLDSDGDGIPDYLDEDDDNDNVLTKDEINLPAGEDYDPLIHIIDTDGDGTPNHLDDDDDGDGALTRLEDTSEDQNPRDLDNRIINEEGMEVYRYLENHEDFMEEFEDSGYIYNYYTRYVTTSFIIENASLEVISSDYIEFGTFENSFVVDNEPEED